MRKNCFSTIFVEKTNLINKGQVSFYGLLIFLLLYIKPLLHLFLCLPSMPQCQLTLLILHKHISKLDDSAFFQTQSYITEICYFIIYNIKPD